MLELGSPPPGLVLELRLHLFDALAHSQSADRLIGTVRHAGDQPFDFFTAVDRRGKVLVLYPGFFEGHGTGTLMARWFDRGAHALTSSFPMGGWRPALQSDDIELVALLGGGIALQRNGTFLRVFPSASPVSRPPPAWLQQIHGHLRLARGATAYAVLPTGVAGCAEQVQILAPAGNTCGALSLPAGDQCAFAPVGLALDGTLTQERVACKTLWWWRRALQ